MINKAIYKFKNAISLVLLLVILSSVSTPGVLAEQSIQTTETNQIVYEGGSNSGSDNMVIVNKTLHGTDYENIFDITLQVQTKVNIEQLYAAQDTAVVIVMDISYTMKNQLSDGTSRYDAAISSAKSFIEKFQEEAEDSNVQCKVGYVAFNTDAHQIVSLTDCNTTAQRDAIISTIESGNNSIINASGYSASPTRFTNIEAGLKMADDMLDASGISNKYVIFLSDGFPTTYLKEGYTGYNPYMNSTDNKNYASQIAGGIGSDGYFYNQKYGKLCSWGTSYSDKGADRAMSMAKNLRQGTKIYAIGIGLGDQSISNYATYVVDCYGNDYDYGAESKNYVIGNDTDDFKSWLKNEIASGYYWDSTDTTGLETAYDEIFVDIKETNEESIKDVWLATDPMSATALSNVEFLYFYDIEGNVVDGDLTNNADFVEENVASLNKDGGIEYISWDLKNSVCTESGDENSRIYTYTLTYRVRLNTCKNDFVMGEEYNTNGVTFLTYQTEVDGVLSDTARIDFPIPSAKGYLGNLSFSKADGDTRNGLEGVKFTLSHNETCSTCCAVGDFENIPDLVISSDKDGMVYINNIPSGHEYMLFESSALNGYVPSDDEYFIKVEYGIVSSELEGKTIFNYTEKSLDRHKEVVVTKKIKSSNINYSNGIPTFIFKIAGVDKFDEYHVYYCVVSFEKEYVDINTDVDGYVSRSVTIRNLTSGYYVVSEEEVGRYHLVDICDVENGAINKQEAVLDLLNNDRAKVTFVNDQYESAGCSHNGLVINNIVSCQ